MIIYSGYRRLFYTPPPLANGWVTYPCLYSIFPILTLGCSSLKDTVRREGLSLSWVRLRRPWGLILVSCPSIPVGAEVGLFVFILPLVTQRNITPCPKTHSCRRPMFTSAKENKFCLYPYCQLSYLACFRVVLVQFLPLVNLSSPGYMGQHACFSWAPFQCYLHSREFYLHHNVLRP